MVRCLLVVLILFGSLAHSSAAGIPDRFAYPEGTYLPKELLYHKYAASVDGLQSYLESKMTDEFGPATEVEFIGNAPGINSTPYFRIRLPEAVSDEDVRKFLWNDDTGLFEYHYVRKQQSYDPLFHTQWNLAHDGVSSVEGFDEPPVSDTGLHIGDAWKLQADAEGVVVAILDSGFDVNHEDLEGVFLPGWSFTSGGPQDDNVLPADMSDVHGTAIAGIIAAVKDNDRGISGIAPGATVLPVKVDFSIRSIVQGISWAVQQGATIIVLPFAGPQYSDWERAVIEAHAANNALFIVAAGNQGQSLMRGGGPYPAAYQKNGTLRVTAHDPQNLLAAFSNWDALVDMAAPGVAIQTTLPGNSYGLVEGTSYAAAHAAGVAALLQANQPGMRVHEQRRAMLGGGVNIPVIPEGSEYRSTQGRTMVGIIRPANVLASYQTEMAFTRVAPRIGDHPGEYVADVCYEFLGPSSSLSVQLELIRPLPGVELMNEGPFSVRTGYGENCMNIHLRSVHGPIAQDALVKMQFTMGEREFVRHVLVPLSHHSETGKRDFSIGSDRFDNYHLHYFDFDDPTDIINVSLESDHRSDLELVLWSRRFGLAHTHFLGGEDGLSFLRTYPKEHREEDLLIEYGEDRNDRLEAANVFADLWQRSGHTALVVNKSGLPIDYALKIEKVGPRGSFHLQMVQGATEGDPEMLLQVFRNGHVGAVSVDYRTQTPESTFMPAVPGRHYDPVNGTLHWQDGDSEPKLIAIPLYDDRLVEKDRVVDVRIANPGGGATLRKPVGVGSYEHVTAIITEDDRLGRIVLAPPANAKRESSGYTVVEGDGDLVFELQRVDGDAGKATADIKIVSSSAKAGVDYVLLNQTVVWEDYETGSRPIIRILDNQQYAGDRFLRIEADVSFDNARIPGAETLEPVWIVRIEEDESEPPPSDDPNPDPRDGGAGGGGMLHPLWLFVLLSGVIGRRHGFRLTVVAGLLMLSMAHVSAVEMDVSFVDEIIPGELLVVWNESHDEQHLIAVHDMFGPNAEVHPLPWPGTYRIVAPEGELADDGAPYPKVGSWHFRRMPMAAIPNDPGFTEQWHLDNPDGTAVPGFHGLVLADSGLNVPAAWEHQTHADGVVIAVLDGDFDVEHPDLSLVFKQGRQFFHDGSTSNGIVRRVGHGTEIAGLIAADSDNGVGIAGVAPGSTILPVQIDFSIVSIAMGIDHAINEGVDFIVLPFMGSRRSRIEEAAIERATSEGILVFAAAGNQGTDLDVSNTSHPASMGRSNRRVIAVAATDPGNALAAFSNFGSQAVQLAAPGVSLLTTSGNGGYSHVSGTSYAAALSAGMAALLKAKRPELKADALVRYLLGAADPEPPYPDGERMDNIRGRTTAGVLRSRELFTDPGPIPVFSRRPADIRQRSGIVNSSRIYMRLMTTDSSYANLNYSIDLPENPEIQFDTFDRIANLASDGAFQILLPVPHEAVDTRREIGVRVHFTGGGGLDQIRYFYTVLAPVNTGAEISAAIGRDRNHRMQGYMFRADEPIDVAEFALDAAGDADLDLYAWHAPLDSQFLEYVIGAPADDPRFFYVPGVNVAPFPPFQTASIGPKGSERVTINYANSKELHRYYVMVVNESGGEVDYTLRYNVIPQRGTFDILPSVFAVSERRGQNVARIRVERDGYHGNVSVNYRTVAGSATPGLDYENTAGTLYWEDGDSDPKWMEVRIIPDGIQEGDETFYIELTDPTGGATLAQSPDEGEYVVRRPIRISDANFAGRITIGVGPSAAGEGGERILEKGRKHYVSVNRQHQADGALRIAAKTVLGPYADSDLEMAVAGVDYQPLNYSGILVHGEMGPLLLPLMIHEDTGKTVPRMLKLVVSVYADAIVDPTVINPIEEVLTIVIQGEEEVDDEKEPSDPGDGGAGRQESGSGGGAMGIVMLVSLFVLASCARRLLFRI